MIKGLPPGSILQLMYLKRRLSKLNVGHFIEIGPGSGDITNVLLGLGWRGISYDLDQTTINKLNDRFIKFIDRNLYQAKCENFINVPQQGSQPDLIISCMVIEHLNELDHDKYFSHCKELISTNGVLISIVPANIKAWGIEDEVAGHFRRYQLSDLNNIAARYQFVVKHLTTLTYPISNLLLPISNYLVKRKESENIQLGMEEKTKLSGRRSVKFKTHFPNFFNLILNEFTLYPLYILQRIFKNSNNALVIYSEFKK